MRIGLFAGLANPVATREYVQAIARGAEERGFCEIWVAEHVVLFDEHESQYPYNADGRFPIHGESGLLDPFPVIGMIAGATDHIRIGTGICLVPQRNPVYTAKEVATADWLSGGRLDFGVGVGWLKEEFDALNVPFEHRGTRTVEYLQVMKTLWQDPVSSYDGRFYTLRDCRMYPKPVQTPHPPIYFGGESDAALKRTVRIGQGWHGFNLTADQALERVARLDTLCAEAGRDRSDLDIVVCPYLKQITRDDLARYADAGVDQVSVLATARDVASIASSLDQLVEEFVEPAKSLS